MGVFAACAAGTGEKNGSLKNGDEDVGAAPSPPIHNLMFATPLDKLAERADHIIYGQVGEVKGAIESLTPDIRLPVSTVTLNVRENWKGKAGQDLTFKSLGAEIDGTPYFSEEMPIFSRGEKVVVFLADFNGTLLPVGHVQGKIIVNEETVGTLRALAAQLIGQNTAR